MTSGQIVDLAEAGIYDATTVLKLAVFSAIASAGLALTIDVLIHRQQQPEHASIRPPSKRKRL